VGLFVGDAGDVNRDESATSILALLQAAGVMPALVCRDRPSGLFASSLGLRTKATEAARSILAELEEAGIDELLVMSAADRWTFEHVYPNRLGVPWPASIAILEVLDVIFDAWSRGTLTLIRRADVPPYAYHDPCHGPRAGRTGASARALLASALGAEQRRELFWREHRAHPCGAIGGLPLTRPDIAGALARSRVSDAVSAGARWLITDDPSCAAHLAAYATDDIEIRGLYELLAVQNAGVRM
jgi:Fe-S oxidoreductase